MSSRIASHGTVAPCDGQCTSCTGTPRARQRWMNSRHSRLLPTPASPITPTICPFGSALRGLSRLIGRETELTWLDGILARSLESNGQIGGGIGEAGGGEKRAGRGFFQGWRAR